MYFWLGHMININDKFIENKLNRVIFYDNVTNYIQFNLVFPLYLRIQRSIWGHFIIEERE